MEIQRFLYGTTADKQDVYGYRLENDRLSVTVIEYGAIITQFIMKERNNRDIVLGYDSLSGYEQDTFYFGASVGRCANRIAKGQYVWHDEVRQLEINNGENHLHGGRFGCHKKIWQSFVESDCLCLRTKLLAKDDGYPGNVDILLRIALEEDKLSLIYEYSADEDSFVNLTNHSYFCLDNEENICNHQVQLAAQTYTPTTDTQIPTGEIRDVHGTAFDLTAPRLLREALSAGKEELALTKGYDHNFMKCAAEGLSLCGSVCVDDLQLRVFSDAPAFQFYTGNWITPTAGKNGALYGPYSGLCIEPQFVPNAINMSHVDSPFIRGGRTYERRMVYQIHCK